MAAGYNSGSTQMQADKFANAAGTGAPSFPFGLSNVGKGPFSYAAGNNAGETISGTTLNNFRTYDPSGNINVTLSNDWVAGKAFSIAHLGNASSSALITLKANDGTTIATLFSGSTYTTASLSATPATNTDWQSITNKPFGQRVALTDMNGTASTNTRIFTYSTIIEQIPVNGDITYTPSATLGDSFTINTPGSYAISLSMGPIGTGFDMYLLLNIATTVGATAANVLANTQHVTSQISSLSVTYWFKANDVIRAASSTASIGSSSGLNNQFRICKVG